MKFEVYCDAMDKTYGPFDSAVIAEKVRGDCDRNPLCDGPHWVEAVVPGFTEVERDWQDEAEDADEAARDREVDWAMDFAAEDEMARYYGGV
jgi:hypothetical protein